MLFNYRSRSHQNISILNLIMNISLFHANVSLWPVNIYTTNKTSTMLTKEKQSPVF